jgi:hypothetical protein
LRLLEQEEEKLKALRQALIEGEKSGFVEKYKKPIIGRTLNRQNNFCFRILL